MSNEQTIRRATRDKDHPYFPTARASAQNTALSYEARGLLWYLLSLPDDWEVKVRTLQIKGKAGRDKVYGIIEELAEAGYIKRPQRDRDEKGRVYWTPYEVYETPIDGSTVNGFSGTGQPPAGKPNAGKPDTAKPSINKRDNQKKDTTKKIVKEKDTQNPASRKRFLFAFTGQNYNDGSRIDPVTFPDEYNAIFWAGMEAEEQAGFAPLLDYDDEWRKQRDGVIALALAHISPEDLKAYLLTEILARDENGKNWHLDGIKRPLFSTVANKISTWLKEREAEAVASKKQGSSWSAHSSNSDAYLQSLEGQRRLLLGMLFGPIEPVNARLAELGLAPDCSIEELKNALEKGQAAIS